MSGLHSTISRFCAALIGLVLLPCASLADTPVTYSDSGRALFEVEMPDFWSLRTGGLREREGPDASDLRDILRVFGMTPEAHDGIWVGFISPHGVSTLDQAREYLREIGPFLVEDATVDAPKSRRISGLPARSTTGKGRRNGTPVDFTVLSIDMPNGRIAICVVIFEAGADAEVVGDINEMLSSFRYIK